MRRDDPTSDSRWYQAGLRFSCERCGNCCSGPSGRVWFSPTELEQMAAHLGLLPFQFVERYTRKLAGRLSLTEVESPHGLDCVFLERQTDGRTTCSIHPVRPTQCRSWPFWPENLASAEEYRRRGAGCSGVEAGLRGRGQRVDADEIERQRDRTPSP